MIAIKIKNGEVLKYREHAVRVQTPWLKKFKIQTTGANSLIKRDFFTLLSFLTRIFLRVRRVFGPVSRGW
ncbi:hypothetical protein E05_13050 [Plautia stali symbiont]|nr:hypothetical protein E05_13050 [Plautia stali symbiont]